MKINKQFLIFKNRQAFERELANETIKETSIAFIKEEELIWTHGTMFGGDQNQHSHAKGYFSSVSKLPHGEEGDWAIVNEDGTEYIYYYDVEDGWVKGGEYKSDDYVLKANLLDYIKNFYDNVYVRKDEVYTPDQYDGDYDSSSESPGGSTTVNPGYTFNIDQQIDKNSFNPVANWVIYNALKNKVDTSVLNDYLTFEQFQTLAANILAADLTQYYTKNQTYSKDQVYNKNQTYSKSEIDNIVSIIPSFDVEVVQNFPTDPKYGVMYVIQDGSDNVLYTSYIYKDGQWIQLGQQRLDIDLSDYVTHQELTSSISDISTGLNTLSTTVNKLSDDIDTLQDDITSVSTTLDNKIDANAAANQAAIDNITNTHYNKDQIDDIIEDRITWDDVYGPGYNPHVGQNYESNTWLKIVTIEQSSYEELQTYEPNTIYFVLEPQTQTNWTFGGTFPITFASDGIGTFPITLQ